MSRRVILTLLLALPCRADAEPPFEHCNYYHFIAHLKAPMIAVEFDPIDHASYDRVILATEKVCNLIRDEGDRRLIVPGTRTATWKFHPEEHLDQAAPPPSYPSIIISRPPKLKT